MKIKLLLMKIKRETILMLFPSKIIFAIILNDKDNVSFSNILPSDLKPSRHSGTNNVLLTTSIKPYPIALIPVSTYVSHCNAKTLRSKFAYIRNNCPGLSL